MNTLLIEQAKFTYYTLRKAFKKQTKTIEDQGEKQVNALKSLEFSDKQLPSIKSFISKERLNPEIVDEIERIEEGERKADRSKMVYKRLWRRGVVVITTVKLHSTKPELSFCAGSNPARGVSEIRDGEDL